MPASRPETRIGDELHPPDVDAGQPRRFLVAADRIDVAAEGGELQQQRRR